ncbi:peptidylprolyl isomerase [Lujinxingia litoralis]|nr:peptidylprolyl isomerase [Lujinxingia litoralis]
MPLKSSTLIALLGLLLAACSSGNAVPDEPTGTEAPQYRSASLDSEEGAQEQTEGETGGIAAVGPVARVNGEEISAEEFNSQVEMLQAQAQLPPELLRQMSSQIIENLIDQHLVDQAIANSGVDPSPEEIDARLQEYREEFEASALEMYGESIDFDEYIAQTGISPEEIRESVYQAVAIEQILLADGLSLPNEDDARQFYDDNPEAFTRGEEVRARHILVRVDSESPEDWESARQEAQALHDQITGGADFAQVARDNSDDGSAQAGGDLGSFGRGRMVPEFEEAAFSMQVDEISEPVRTDFGWHIIQVTERSDEETMSFESVQDQLTRELRNQALQQSLGEYVAQLRESAEIETMPENIK